ncbi:MAG: hypothetical protein H6832_13905 [Planctomycetes bacterium]|nr:hypothetical protein [Planctomycetota bacterium]MCB9891250.1 hypothetical protein [Planctomycetota bacterium]MCB9919491.1 hypothetical protein [Planctomycetota bacterium]
MEQDNAIDASEVEYDFEPTDVLEYGTVRPGTYLCRVDEARPGWTRSGFKRWGLKFVVHEGPNVGRVAAWDGLTFSPKAAGRTKQVLSALGLPHEGTVRIRADDLLGRLAFVTVELGEYRNPDTGQLVRRNQVPYGGVEAVGPSRDPSTRRATHDAAANDGESVGGVAGDDEADATDEFDEATVPF